MEGSCNQDLTASPSQILLYLRLRHSLPPTCVTTLLVMQRSRVADPSTPSWNYPNAVRADDQAGYCYCRKRTHWRRWRASERKAVHEGENIAESAMRRRKRGTLRSGKGGKGGRVKSRKQAIAIGLSEARKKGAKVPQKKSS